MLETATHAQDSDDSKKQSHSLSPTGFNQSTDRPGNMLSGFRVTQRLKMKSFLLCGSPLDATLLGVVERIKPTLISSTG